MANSQVTVFIPTRNRLELLKRAVESVLSQSASIHLHILDNASTDGTVDWLRHLKEKTNNLTITLREKNIGAMPNFTDAFCRVETPYLIPLADDDTLLPGFVAEALRFARTHPEVGAVVFQGEICSDGQCQWKSPRSPVEGIAYPREHLPRWMIAGHYYSWSSILWSSDAVRTVNPSITLTQFDLPSDVWFQFKVFLRYPVLLVEKSGATFNASPNQASGTIGASPQAMSWFANMAAAMREELTASRLFSEEETRNLMKSIVIYWNTYILHRELRDVLYDDDSIRRMLDIYMTSFFPICGFAEFPLLSVLQTRKCREREATALPTAARIGNKSPLALRQFKDLFRMLVPPLIYELLASIKRMARTAKGN